MQTHSNAAPSLRELQAEISESTEAAELDLLVGSRKSVVKMLRVGLEIEADQYVIIRCLWSPLILYFRCTLQTLRDLSASSEDVKGAAKRLMRRIDAWQPWRRSVFTSACQVELSPTTPSDISTVHSVPLELASGIVDTVLLEPECCSPLKKLQEVECRLRIALAEDYVRELRGAIAVRAAHEAVQTRSTALSNQQPQTRATAAQLAAQQKVSHQTLFFPDTNLFLGSQCHELLQHKL